MGTATDLIIDSMAGTVAYLVVASGGFLGVGETRYALPWRCVRPMPAESRMFFTEDRLLEKFEIMGTADSLCAQGLHGFACLP